MRGRINVANRKKIKGLKKPAGDIAARLAGYRLTAQRWLLLDLLQGAEHLDADALYLKAREKDPHISLSTIYRNLRFFRKLGLVEEHHFDEATSYYELKADTPHHHMRCLGCGKIIDFEYPLSPEIKDNVAGHGFHATGIKMFLVGYCSDCLRKRETTV
jgi:Fe2+ or Zn2+ uptake regulation protein